MSNINVMWVKFSSALKKDIKTVLKVLIHKRIWIILKSIFPVWEEDLTIHCLNSKEWSNARRSTPWSLNAILEKGVNLVGYLQAANGLGEAARRNIMALETTNIPFEIIDYEVDIPAIQKLEHSYKSLKSPGFKFNTNLFHINPHQLPLLWDYFDKSSLVGHYNIGVWYWELPVFPDKWAFSFSLVDEIWVASQFIMDSIQEKSPVPIFKIPPCINVNVDPRLNRSSFKLPQDVFLFLCAYDVLSIQARKNPQGVIEAFKRVFKSNDSSVGLVVKISNAKENPEGIHKLKEELRGYKNCFFIEETYTRVKFNSLLNVVDAYVSLHRSEGFGLIPAESMFLGKPVIMTEWSGNVDFMTSENSCGVAYRLIPVGKCAQEYDPDQLWADPDIDQAAQYMIRLVSDSAYYSSISVNAKNDIRSNNSEYKIGHILRERLVKSGVL